MNSQVISTSVHRRYHERGDKLKSLVERVTKEKGKMRPGELVIDHKTCSIMFSFFFFFFFSITLSLAPLTVFLFLFLLFWWG